MGRETPDTDDARRRHTMVLAEAALGRYGLQEARLHLLRHEFTQVFRVELPTGEKFALRMYGTPRAAREELRSDDPRLRTTLKLRSLETLREQLTWLSVLGRETDLLVPEPMPLPDGSLVGYVSVEGVPECRHCTLVRWVPGRHKREDLTLVDLSLVGFYLARLHDHAERYRTPDPSVLPRWDWHWPFGESVPLWSKGEAFYSAEQMTVFEETAQRVRRDLEELGYGNEVFGLVHRDLNLNNLMFGDGTVGAIDFDLCGLGHYLLDLATILGALRSLHTHRIEWLREALLEGYERERSLPMGYRKYFGTFSVMRRVAALNRDLELLSGEATRYQARGHRFLRNTVMWLRRNYLSVTGSVL
jgi:Ser/Thr protein kinase RdoA (MazF antagonist)